MSIATYKHEYESLLQNLDEAIAHLSGAATAGSEHQGKLEAMTGSSARPEADEAKRQIAEAGNKIDEVMQSVQAAKMAIESYISAV